LLEREVTLDKSKNQYGPPILTFIVPGYYNESLVKLSLTYGANFDARDNEYAKTAQEEYKARHPLFELEKLGKIYLSKEDMKRQ
jgi:hypothetical protein